MREVDDSLLAMGLIDFLYLYPILGWAGMEFVAYGF